MKTINATITATESSVIVEPLPSEIMGIGLWLRYDTSLMEDKRQGITLIACDTDEASLKD